MPRNCKHNGGDFDNIKRRIDEQLKKGVSIFAYSSIPCPFVGKVGRVRKGLFSIAKQLGVTITPLAVDYIEHNIGMIPYQRFEIRVGDTFHVEDPLRESLRARKFFKKAISRFRKKKFMV